MPTGFVRKFSQIVVSGLFGKHAFKPLIIFCPACREALPGHTGTWAPGHTTNPRAHGHTGTNRRMRLPATGNDDGGCQSAAPATKTGTHFLKTSQKSCACHTKRPSTRSETCWNHKVPRLPCETRRCDIWNHQKWPFCRNHHRHSHTGLPRSVADGCERFHTIERTHPQPPDP